MGRKVVDAAVIIPDASPVLTLGRVGRIDLLGSFSVPIRIVDQVHHEITKPENDPTGEVAAGLRLLHNQIEIRDECRRWIPGAPPSRSADAQRRSW